MNILVFGATGLVGTHVTKKFLHKDFNVIAIGRKEDRLQYLDGLGAETVKFELSTAYEDFMIFDKYIPCTIINCAAAISGADSEVLQLVNIEATKKIVRKAEELGSRLVHISSYSVYGVNGTEYKETDPYNGGSVYSQSKIIAEEIVKQSKCNWTILRPPYIIGPLDRNVLNDFSTRIRKKKMPLIGKKGVITFIDARDIANIIILVLANEKTVREIYNVASKSIPLHEFIELFGDMLEAKKPYGKKYPFWLVYTIALFFDILAKIQGKNNENSLSRYRIMSLTTVRTMNLDKLTTDLAFQPQYSLKESIQDWLNHKS